MGLFDGIEKLITEHGSANILRERIALANDQHAALEKKAAALEAENKKLQLANSRLEEKCRELQQKISQGSNSNPDGHHCDHCGGQNLKRTGARPDPTFGDLGIKEAIFSCQDCAKPTYIQQRPNR